MTVFTKSSSVPSVSRMTLSLSRVELARQVRSGIRAASDVSKQGCFQVHVALEVSGLMWHMLSSLRLHLLQGGDLLHSLTGSVITG